jgi:hypothetical protein
LVVPSILNLVPIAFENPVLVGLLEVEVAVEVLKVEALDVGCVDGVDVVAPELIFSLAPRRLKKV